MKEKDYYNEVQRWFEEDKKCVPRPTNYRFDGLALLTGDIVGSRDGLIYACELKNYPYPIGAQGWGSVGQALALRLKADFVYIGCVASEIPASRSNNWKRASAAQSVRKLLTHLFIKFPETFDEYRATLETVFRCFFEDLGIGLLVVHESSLGDQSQANLSVIEIVPPKRTRRTPPDLRST